MYKLILFTLLSVNLYSEDSILTINNLIKNNLNFVQSTDSGFKEINSKGTLIRNNELIEIMIDFPTKEKYIIRDSIIEIYDYEFNQSQIFEINDDNSFVIDLLDNGIDTKKVNYIDDNSFIVSKNKSDFFIKIISDSKFLISYSDNMNYENSIVFEAIEKK